MPLAPAPRLKLARELEKLAALVFGEEHVAAFLRGLMRQLEALHRDGLGSRRELTTLLRERPAGVDGVAWVGLFEFVVLKAALLLTPTRVLPFLQNLCCSERFSIRL